MAIRVLIGDDDPLIREALAVIFGKDEDFKLVALVDNGAEAVKHCRSSQVDVALLDIRMPVVSGIDAAADITSSTGCRVLLLSTFKDDELVQGALAGGASGYLLKGCEGREIKEAVRLVHAGHTVFQKDVFSTIREGSRSPRGDISFLTEREQEIIKLVAEGYSNKQAAEALSLTEGTVKNYISSMLDKLGLNQRTQIAVYYVTGRKDFT
ncbi:MAG: response regulator transcription factor [Spirochaetales bacterium]|nr:response regulator transcription factor [Spirochaetales bacterium]